MTLAQLQDLLQSVAILLLGWNAWRARSKR